MENLLGSTRYRMRVEEQAGGWLGVFCRLCRRKLRSFIKAALLIFFAVVIASCNSDHRRLNINELVDQYAMHPEDSLKKEAALFFRDQLAYQSSEKNTFCHETSGKVVAMDWDSIHGEAHLSAFLNTHNVVIREELVPDGSILTKGLLESHINSYDFYVRNWEWNRKADKRTLHNYLLAYKIYQEEPAEWRNYFISEHSFFLKMVLASQKYGLAWFGQNPTPLAIKLMDVANNWYTYKGEGTSRYGSLSFPLMKCIRKGDCYFAAYTGVYTLRSFGIPAAMDYVPVWGSRNGAHAEVAALDSAGKMSAIPLHQLKQATKVFRLSFIPVNVWHDSIRPFMGKDSFLLPAIAHDHWEDVTADHTEAGDVHMVMYTPVQKEIAYICAFNYGTWQPVYWGRVQNGGHINFRKMGKDILYCAAWPEGNSFRLTGHPFLWDSTGRQQYFIPDVFQLQKMKLSKLNTGSRAWVEKGKTYTLFYLDRDGGWQKISDIKCTHEATLPVVEAPSGRIYRLVDKNGNSRLERPFEYKDDKQVWR